MISRGRVPAWRRSSWGQPLLARKRSHELHHCRRGLLRLALEHEVRRVERDDPQVGAGRSQASSHSGSDQSVPLAREVEDWNRTLLGLSRYVDREHLLHTAGHDAPLDRADRGRGLLRELSSIRSCQEHANCPQGWPDPQQGRDWPTKRPPTSDRALREARSQYDSEESSGSAGRQAKCNRPREGLGDQHEAAEATELAGDSVAAPARRTSAHGTRGNSPHAGGVSVA